MTLEAFTMFPADKDATARKLEGKYLGGIVKNRRYRARSQTHIQRELLEARAETLQLPMQDLHCRDPDPAIPFAKLESSKHAFGALASEPAIEKHVQKAECTPQQFLESGRVLKATPG